VSEQAISVIRRTFQKTLAEVSALPRSQVRNALGRLINAQAGKGMLLQYYEIYNIVYI